MDVTHLGDSTGEHGSQLTAPYSNPFFDPGYDVGTMV